MPKIKYEVRSYQEVAHPDGKIKLPKDVEITLPAEKLSENGREWTDVSNGVSASNRAIERGAPKLYMYLGHPCWEDPVVIGMIPATELTLLVENSDKSVTFHGVMQYGSEKEINKAGLWVGGAIAAGVEPDCSIRAAADWKWREDDTPALEIPKGDYPLVIDWLSPNEQPGIPGTKLSNVSSWESAAKQIKKHFTESALFKGIIDDLITSIKKEIKTQQAGNNTTGRKENKMSVALKVSKEEMSADILEQIKELPDKDTIVIFIMGMLAAMGVKDDAAADDMSKMDEEPSESNFGNDETGKESFVRAQKLWKAKEAIIPTIRTAIEKHKAAVQKTQKESTTVPKTTTTTEASEGQPRRDNPPAAEPGARQMTEAEARQGLTLLGINVDRLKADQEAAIAKEKSGERLTSLTEAFNKAVKEKAKFHGHEVWDLQRYPQVPVDKMLAEAADVCTTQESTVMLMPKLLEVVTKQAQLEAMRTANKPLPGKGQFESIGSYSGNGGWAGEQTELVKVAEERVVAPMLEYIKRNHREQYAQYESNSKKPEFQERVAQVKESYNRVYREDFTSNGLSQNGNYPALMLGGAIVNQWIPSKIIELAQSGPQFDLTLGRVSAGGNMPVGQFVEITSSSYTQVRDYDLAERQLPTDGLPQVEFFSQPHQYFAKWRQIEIVWDDELLYWLGLDPYRRDIKAEAAYFLNEYLTKQTELMISSENVRSNCAYGATALTNETLNLSQANHFVVFGSDPKVVEGYTISNAVGYFKLRRGQSSGTTTLALGPIVPPGISPFLERSTESLINTHPVTLAAIGGKTQYRGKYDRNLQKGVRINESDPEPTYLVLPHVGIVVMLEGSNFDGVNATVVSQYTPVSNYTRFDCALANGETHQIKGNQLVELIIRMIADLRVKRQVKVEDIDYLIGSALILEGQLALGSHFQGQNKLDYANMGPGMVANMQYLEVLRRCLIYGTTDPVYDDSRLLTLGSSKNLVYKPYRPPMLGPLQVCGKTNRDGKLVRTAQTAQSLTVAELIATIPVRDPQTDAPKNFGNANIYIVNPPESTGLPA